MNLWFKRSLPGEDFPAGLIGGTGLVGFHVTRAVLAASVQPTETTLQQLLRSDQALQLRDGIPATPQARVLVEDIWPAEAEDGVAMANAGFSGSPMETTETVS